MSTLNRRILPGFRLSLSYSLTYLTILVLIPIAACFAKASTLTWEIFWGTVWTERALRCVRADVWRVIRGGGGGRRPWVAHRLGTGAL